MKIEREDGLSHDDEFDALCEYEEQIDSALDNTFVHYVGRITTAGMRQFYFYAPNQEEFDSVIDDVIDSNSDYLFQKGAKEDREWSQFSSVLYPGKFGLEQIAKRADKL